MPNRRDRYAGVSLSEGLPGPLISVTIVVKSLQVYHNLHDVIENDELSEFGSRIDWITLYLSLVLATTLMCTCR